MRVTVIDRFRALGLATSNEMTWAAGDIVRDRYEEKYGEPPPKELRRKTIGVGSHCFATYPLSFIPVIDEIVRAMQAADDAQGRLFEDL